MTGRGVSLVGFFDWLKSTEQPEPEPTPGSVPGNDDAGLAAGREQAEQIAARRPGRPPAGTDERIRRIGLTVSEAEHARLKQAAEKAGRKQLSRWCREVLVARLEDQESVDRGEVSASVQAQLARIGNNLNQLARAAHRGSGIDPGQARALQEQFQALRRELGQ